ncbi:MAG: methylated-DNA--[protein]-cysteine S-methyltransferase [Candidatus Gastranaerophilaceae bacterium]|nr:methylated-DNA--[protein]-cysteine S-methyltransferase [Candidatus Gastranaerophilaceae bacterium]
MNYYTKQTSIGSITIAEDRGFITSLSFGKKIFKGKWDKCFWSDVLNDAFNELDEYLNGKRKDFNLPLNPKGTPFQQKVWSCLYNIPYGETRSYKDIAELIGNENSSRAVGMANNKNPIPIFIPCHRVIGADGTLTGYAGGLDIKQKLLNNEKLYNQSTRPIGDV